MTDPIALAEEFVDDLTRGNVESYLMDFINLGLKTNLGYQQFDKLLEELYDAIGEYQLADSEKRQLFASRLVSRVRMCRLKGLLKNNPNTVKALVAERDFYKSRTDAAEKRANDLENNLKSAYGAVEKLMGDIEKMKLKGFEKKE